jgi:hypothetical protein
MTNPKGTQLETATVNWLREHGFPFARRIVKEGVRDKGDVTLGDGIPVTIEAKNTRSFDLAGAQRELADEMENARHRWGFAIHKKRGTTNVGDYYAVLPVHVLADILRVALKQTAQPLEPSVVKFVREIREAHGDPPAEDIPKRVRRIPRR